MSQNLVIPNKDNKVVMLFGGIDLTLATNIVVTFGSETYSLIDDPAIVVVESATEISLDLSSTNEVGNIFATVTYFDSGSVNGTDITSRELSNLDKIIIAKGSQLIIEDGSIVSGANSYTTDQEFKSWANINNHPIPATEPERDALAVKAYSLLNDEYESKIQGSRVSIEQTGFMPRDGMRVRGFDIEPTSITNDVKLAQMVTMLNISEGATTTAFVEGATGTSGGALASFEVPGVYKESYQAGTSAQSTSVLASFPAVTKILKPYFINGGRISLGREDMGYLG